MQLVIVSNLYLCLTCHCVLPLRGLNLSLCLTCYGGCSNNKKDHAAGKIGYVKIFESLVHNPDLKELNKLRTRIVFFLKLDNGKSGLSP